jgi:hypothetical protein
MLFWVITCLAWNAASAQKLTLTDTNGRSIEVQIVGVTDEHVACIKPGYTKEIKIPLSTLDAETKKRITDWRIETGKLPRKEFSMNIASRGNRPKEYVVKFKVPEGNYTSIPERNGIILKYDKLNGDGLTGQLHLWVTPIDKKKEFAAAEIRIDFEEDLAGQRAKMSPNERTAHEASARLREVSHGDFTGYTIDSESAGKAIKTTNGKFSTYLIVSPVNQKEEYPIKLDDLLRILGTLQIAEKP